MIQLVLYVIAVIALYKLLIAKIHLTSDQYEAILKELPNMPHFVLFEGREHKTPIPGQYIVLGIWRRIPMLLSKRKLYRLMPDVLTPAMLYCFRWNRRRFWKKIDKNLFANDSIHLYVMGWRRTMGKLNTKNQLNQPYLADDVLQPVENDIKAIAAQEKSKVGVILHGYPGNGKSYLIRYLAVKYRLSIHIMVFDRDMSNSDLINMFADVQGPSIVVFEDFDCYFDEKTCSLAGANFSLDTLLNILDGMYCTPQHIAFFMTANDISRIDTSLKDRPSRFKHVVCIDAPDEEMRKQIFEGDMEKVRATKGLSLDQCLHYKDSNQLPKLPPNSGSVGFRGTE